MDLSRFLGFAIRARARESAKGRTRVVHNYSLGLCLPVALLARLLDGAHCQVLPGHPRRAQEQDDKSDHRDLLHSTRRLSRRSDGVDVRYLPRSVNSIPRPLAYVLVVLPVPRPRTVCTLLFC